jgi:hypothetical protein
MARVLHEDCTIEVCTEAVSVLEMEGGHSYLLGDRLFAKSINVPEKQMIFRFVPIFEVSTRAMPGRLVSLTDFTTMGVGLTAVGAMNPNWGE